MLKSHEKFHSSNGKRLILIADDEFINREILRGILQEEYELVFAENGKEALELMHEHKDFLSLVLLDLMMPVMSGIDTLKEAKQEGSEISKIPIIVVTSDQEAEVESLTLGAIDFIPKPYPQQGVIMARIRRVIELSEDRQIISSTERDELTGLYNREYFYRYAEQFDQYHQDMEMDAIVVDVNHFNMINERFGTAYGDSVLRHIGEALRATMQDIGGMTCRREADTFLIYCPHGQDYTGILKQASQIFAELSKDNTRAWLRMGVYASVDKSLDIERRFDRAKMAADTVKGSFTKTIAVYDNELHEKELYAEQLIGDFDKAIEGRQFKVYYQPKFDVRPDIPVLASAEALIRWFHPECGMISPGVFIRLFENNGLIHKLDRYVWNEAAAQIAKWKAEYGITLPVSVNVSRVDVFDPMLGEELTEIVRNNGLTTAELLLEITESAYTDNSQQICDTVAALRELGFRIEMDDFGSGYSSLNMLTSLAIDALKLDMRFIKHICEDPKSARLVGIMIEIARLLEVPVIAEGVEKREQMELLKEMDCDVIQGYYFSRPLPSEQFAGLIEKQLKGECGC